MGHSPAGCGEQPPTADNLSSDRRWSIVGKWAPAQRWMTAAATSYYSRQLPFAVSQQYDNIPTSIQLCITQQQTRRSAPLLYLGPQRITSTVVAEAGGEEWRVASLNFEPIQA